MKISYRTHPVLEKIDKGSLGILAILNQDKNQMNSIKGLLETVWSTTCFDFKKNIQYISKPFGEAIHTALPKMTSGELVHLALLDSTSGTFLWGDNTFCYAIDNINNEITITYLHFVKGVDRNVFLNAFFYITVKSEGIKGNARYFFSNIESTYKDAATLLKYHNSNLIATLNFIKYADVEVKELRAGQRDNGIFCKYTNDTKNNIKILDSKWFTTLVKSDGFKVRGHFRLQPKKKDGEWTKELIWITDFEKTGYTAPARKL